MTERRCRVGVRAPEAPLSPDEIGEITQLIEQAQVKLLRRGMTLPVAILEGALEHIRAGG